MRPCFSVISVLGVVKSHRVVQGEGDGDGLRLRVGTRLLHDGLHDGGALVGGGDEEDHLALLGDGDAEEFVGVLRVGGAGMDHGAAAGTGALGRLTRRTESGYVRSYAGYMLAGTVLVLIAVLAARF